MTWPGFEIRPPWIWSCWTQVVCLWWLGPTPEVMERTKTIKNNALSQFLWCLIRKGAVPERPGTRWSTALVWHLQGPSACSKHLDTPTQQWTTQCNTWVVILGPSHTSKQLYNQTSPIWNALALYRPVCLCEWLQWMGFRRNILDNINGLSYLIYTFF